MAHVELRELRRSFGHVIALQGINLALETGEFVSLLGPSGCGKTTALRLVAGQDLPRVVATPQALITKDNVDLYSGAGVDVRAQLLKEAAGN